MINDRTSPCAEGLILSASAASTCPDRSKPWVLAATIIGSGMAILDGAIVNVALPIIGTGLAASITVMQWVVNAYVMVTAALNLLGGSAGDRFGRRRIFAIGIVVFVIGSIWCGLAAGALDLVAARILQGVGGALMIPNSLALIGATFEKDQRGRAIGTWAGATAIVGALGPVLGGWLTDAVSWRAIFFVNLPFAFAALVIIWRHMPESREAGATSDLDWRGAALAATGLSAVTFALIQYSDLGWRHPAVFGSLVAGALLLALFVRVEATSAAPMMPLTLFRSRTFSGINLMTLLLYAALAGAFFFIPFNLIRVQGYSAALAGAAFLPFPLILTALSRWSGELLDRFGAKLPLTIGPLIAAVGLALFAWPGIGGTYWLDFFPPMAILGLGMAVSVAPLTTTVINAVPARHTGVASGVNNAVADIAALLAVALFGAAGLAVFVHALDGHLMGISLSPNHGRIMDTIKESLAGTSLPATIPDADRMVLKAAIDASFLVSFRLLMLGAAILALLGSLCAALTLAGGGRKPQTDVIGSAR